MTSDTWLNTQMESGVESLVSRSEKWEKDSGVRKGSSVTHEHKCVHRALQYMATVDGINLRASIGAEYLLRRIQMHEEAIAESPESPSYEGAEHYMGVFETGSGEAAVAAGVSARLVHGLACGYRKMLG